MNDLVIEVFGVAEKEICSGCDHGCDSCAPGAKRKTFDLFREFEALARSSEFSSRIRTEFVEISDESIKRHEDVQKLLSMAELDPIIVINGKIAYLGGFSPEGLLQELRKKNP